MMFKRIDNRVPNYLAKNFSRHNSQINTRRTKQSGQLNILKSHRDQSAVLLLVRGKLKHWNGINGHVKFPDLHG